MRPAAVALAVARLCGGYLTLRPMAVGTRAYFGGRGPFGAYCTAAKQGPHG